MKLMEIKFLYLLNVLYKMNKLIGILMHCIGNQSKHTDLGTQIKHTTFFFFGYPITLESKRAWQKGKEKKVKR